MYTILTDTLVQRSILRICAQIWREILEDWPL